MRGRGGGEGGIRYELQVVGGEAAAPFFPCFPAAMSLLLPLLLPRLPVITIDLLRAPFFLFFFGRGLSGSFLLSCP